MRVEHLLSPQIDHLYRNQYEEIVLNCSQFLRESNGKPLYKHLPVSYADVKRVKVRHQKHNNIVTEAYDRAFNISGLRGRAVFTHSYLKEQPENTDLFYVFPPDKYQFLYNRNVTDSSAEYKQIIETLGDDEHAALDIVADLIKYTYTNDNLCEALRADTEVMLFNIPYFYAVRVSSMTKYPTIE